MLEGRDEIRRWRVWRGVYYSVLAAIFLPIAYGGSNYLTFGKWSYLSPADFAGDAKNKCVPVVLAIKEYHRDFGEWPDDISRLTPKYLVNPDSRIGIGRGRLDRLEGFNETVVYDFTPGKEGWFVSGPLVNGPIPLPLVELPAATQSPGEGK